MINFTLLDNLKIKNKLVALFSAVLFGFIILGATYWLGIEANNTAGSRSNAFIEYESLSNQAQKNYLKMRKYETDFALSISGDSGETYNNAPLEKHKKHTQELETIMAELSSAAQQVDVFSQDVVSNADNADTEDYVRNLVAQATEVTANYKSSFSDIKKFQKLVGLTEHDGLRNIANNKFDQLDKSVASIQDSSLFAYMQLMKESQGRIIRSTDLTAAYEELKQASNDFKSYLKVSDISAGERINMNAYIDEYVSSMNSIVSNKRRANQYTELYDFMLGPIFDEMGQSANNRIDQNTIALSKQTNQLKVIFISTILIVAALLSVILFMFGRSIAKPIESLQSTIHQVNQGRLDARSNMTREDELGELGELSEAFDMLLDEKVAQLSGAEKENDQLNESIVDLLKSVAQLSRKDFTVRVPVAEDVTGAVGDSLNLLAKETGDALNEVRTISMKVAGVSMKVKDQTKMVMGETLKERKQAESAMSEIRVATTAMQKISSDAQQANEQADAAFSNTQVALDTVNESVQGINSIRDTISETEKRIKRLGERSQEITGVVNLINSISERTHILALNASMHAASAGEARRGFAVVADEVQRLAENAREATKEIGTLVNNIQVETGDTVIAMNDVVTQVAKGTELACKAENAMLMTQASTKELVDAVDLIAHSSKLQAKATNGLLDQANEIVESTRQTDKHMKQQSVNTELLGRYPKGLVETVSEFKLISEQQPQAPAIETTSVDELEKELDMNLMASNQ